MRRWFERAKAVVDFAVSCRSAPPLTIERTIQSTEESGWEFDKALEEANKIGLRNQAHLIEFVKEYVGKKKKK